MGREGMNKEEGKFSQYIFTKSRSTPVVWRTQFINSSEREEVVQKGIAYP